MQTLYLPSFRATTFAGGGLKAVVKVYKKIEFRMEGYIFQPYKEILAGEEGGPPTWGPAFSDRSYLASATLAYLSPLGPLSIGVNYYDKVRQSWAFNLNFGYILFNKRALP
jgi:NTE family protein